MSAPENAELTAHAVTKVASLARLTITDAERDEYLGQLAAIVGYIDTLKTVDVTGVEPMSHPTEATDVLRPDVVVPGLDREAALSNAPETDGSAFLVPQILEGADG